MADHGKKYIEAAKLVDPQKLYEPGEAVGLLRQTSFVKFDPTIELHFRLGVDVRHADDIERGPEIWRSERHRVSYPPICGTWCLSSATQIFFVSM